MKEIIVNSTSTSTYKIIIMDNSVSFVEEYIRVSNGNRQYQTNHTNIFISNIQNIKCTHAIQTIKGQTKVLPFVAAAVLLIIAIVLLCFENWIPGGICFFVSIIVAIAGIFARKPEETSSSQTLIVESNDKVLYQKRVEIDNTKLYEIINSIREKQPNMN